MIAVVDNIDGSYARLLIGDDAVAISVAVSHLPPRAHEGMVLRVRFSADQAATNAQVRKGSRAE